MNSIEKALGLISFIERIEQIIGENSAKVVEFYKTPEAYARDFRQTMHNLGMPMESALAKSHLQIVSKYFSTEG